MNVKPQTNKDDDEPSQGAICDLLAYCGRALAVGSMASGGEIGGAF
ncbi:MAG: hypothetical protein SFU91_13995 [Chloroherpetonaceae bacterium]|nr:hypothetical protein [Chloroherpetonaceae bacterium]